MADSKVLPRTMQDADECLTQLISKDKEALIHSVQTRHLVVKEVSHYLQRLKLDVSSLSVIHVAGTKGKGSTCAFTESILRAYGLKTGLYTSPHLIRVTERFAINGEPVSDEHFLTSFFYCWDVLHATKSEAGDNPPLPSYFRFLTLVGFHLFVSQRVDVLVLEVGMGGRLDATNIVDSPVLQVTGISPIGYDHMEILGNTLALIAREKGGILKPNVPAFSSVQPAEAMTAITQCAAENGITITVVPPLVADAKTKALPPLGLAGVHQHQNASLACALAHRWLIARQSTLASKALNDSTAAAAVASVPADLAMNGLPDRFKRGLAACSWPGRCQIIRNLDKLIAPATTTTTAAAAATTAVAAAKDSKQSDAAASAAADAWSERVTFYLDGAHTDASILVCLDWFKHIVAADEASDNASASKSGITKTEYILLFNCGHTRDPFELLSPIVELYQPTAAATKSAASVLDSKSAEPAASASAPSIAFSQILFSPFDEDRPHLQSIPSLDKLATRHKRTVAPANDAKWKSPLAVTTLNLAAANATAATATATAPKVVAPWQHTLFGVWDSLLFARQSRITHPSLSTPAPAAAAAASVAATAPAPIPYPSHGGVVSPTVSGALTHIRQLSNRNPTVRYRVLATGSLYLVGNILKHLNWKH